MTPLKMCVRSAASVSGSAWTWIGPRARALAHHAVGEQPDRQDVVEVRMADQDVLDPGQRVERHVADAGAGVDQDVIVEQEGGCPATGGDGAGATEYLDDHALPEMRAPLQLGSSGG